MNRIYYPVWEKTKRILVTVSKVMPFEWFCRPFGRGAVILAFMLAAGGSANAIDPGELPTGGNVTSGQANISQTGSSMTIDQQTNKLTAEWDTFNIGQDASVEFMQPGSSSVALNRIHDQNPSQIFGRLSSNGQVFLLNPSGVYFGPTAQVDAGALTASTLNISDENFLEGKYSFENSGDAGSIMNDGKISALRGGYVAFIAPEIKNRGYISADKGPALFAAGDRVSLDFTGDGLLTFSVDKGAIAAQIENRGLIQTNNGTVMMTAKAADDIAGSVINNTGIIEAKGATEQGGRILLFADGGQATISGALDASSDAGAGGNITVTGERVLVESGAHLNSSGATGGGEVLVGGSWQGNDPYVHQATATVIKQGALLEANATDKGDGGTVVAWSDVLNPNSVTRAYGAFEAKGGPNGGNGGRIETSGHWLDVSGSQGGASAAHGLAGVWLFDPYNVTITGSDANGTWSGANPDLFSPSSTGSTINAATIAGKLQGGTSVTVTTNGGGAEIGDITVSSAITKASGNTDVTLTLNAANSIVVNQAISNTGGSGKLHVVLDADNNNGTGDGAGIVLLNNNITTNGGNLSFGTGRTATIGGVSTLVGGDVFVDGSAAQTISTNGGTVDVKGEMLIANTNGLTINSNGGNIRFYGLLNSGNSYSFVQNWNSGINGVWTDALTNAKSGNGNTVGDTYLATITSRLENAIAGRAANYAESWLGARRVIGIGTDSYWRWVAGPEGLEDSGNGQVFFSQNSAIGTGGGMAVNGAYSNWVSGEPNNWTNSGGAGSNKLGLSYAGETALQFVGNQGQWNDLSANSSEFETKNLPYVKETNLAASPLTINAGVGTVTFSGAVETSKALASLNVTSTSGIAINGGAVTTEGVQSYNGNVTLGTASTTLTQTNANTDFTIQSGKTITNAYGADTSLTIKTTGSILMDSSSMISSSTGRLNTILWADSDANGGGTIWMKDNTAITSNGGDVTLSGGSDYTSGFAQGISNVGNYANGIFLQKVTISSNGGNVTLRGKGANSQTAFNVRGYKANMGILADCAAGDCLNVDSGTGRISIYGVSQDTAGDRLNAQGISFMSGKITSASIASDAITIVGDASATNNMGWAMGADLRGTIQSTNGGGVTISGIGGRTTGASGSQSHGVVMWATGNILSDSGSINITGTVGIGGTGSVDIYQPGYIGYKSGTNVTFSSSNITLNANTLTLAGTDRLQSYGTLTIQPREAANTIGIAGGAGTLSLPVSYFSTNFTNGFSGITIGSANAGNITIGNTALTYNDPLTLKTAGNITLNSNASLTGTAGQSAHLTLWADADNNDNGYINMTNTASITTNGGKITMGGGTDPATDYAVGNSTQTTGVNLLGSLNGGGGNITVHGQGLSSGGTGIFKNTATTIQTSGTGNIGLYGIGYVNGLGIYHSGGTITALNGNITLDGTANNTSCTGQCWGINFLIGSSATTANGNILLIGRSSDATKYGTSTYLSTLSTTGTGTVTQQSISGKTWVGTLSTTGSGDVNINAVSTIEHDAGSPALQVGGNLTINANGMINDPGQITVNGTTSISAGAGNNITLTNVNNNFSGAISVASGNNVSIVDSDTMTLSSINVEGLIDIATLTGDLTLTGAVSTTNATANAILLNAGKNAAAGTSTGGNIIVSGGSLSMGAGGTARLYSGSITGSTGLTGLVGSGSGRFRYNADETTDFSSGGWAALGTGLNAIYREQPLLSVTPDSTSMTYGASTPAISYTLSGQVNGDTSLGVAGTATYNIGGATSTAGYLTAGAHDISYNTGLTNNLGYGFADNAGSTDELTVNQRAITISGITAANKVYDANRTATVDTTGAAGWLAGDTVTVSASGLFDNKNVGTGKTVTLTSSYGGADAGNYSITDQASAIANITPRPITISGITASNKVYDANRTATVDTTGAAGWLAGDTVTVSASGLFDNKNVGTGKTVTLTSSYGGADAGNYSITDQTTTTADITPALLTVRANNDLKVLDNIPYSGGNGVVYEGFADNETPSVLNGIVQYRGTSQGAINAGLYDIEPFGLLSDNYEITYINGLLTIMPNSKFNIDLISRDNQKGINSTGQDQRTQTGGSFASLMGPGSGSSVMAGYAGFEVMAINITETGSFSLSSESGSTMASFIPGPEGGSIMNIEGASPGEMKTIINSLPVFEQIGPADPVWVNNYTISKNNQALSAAPADSNGVEEYPKYGIAEKEYPFTLAMQDGISVQYTAGITDEGYVVISLSSSGGNVDIEKIILMGITVIEKETKKKADDIKGVVIIKRGQAI